MTRYIASVLLLATVVAAGCAAPAAGGPAAPSVSPPMCMPCSDPCYPGSGCGGAPKVAAAAPVPAAAPAPAPVPAQPPAAPTFSPPGGTFEGAQAVHLHSATAGAVVRCTTDGTEPVATSQECRDPVHVGTGTTTVKARAFSPGAPDGAVSTATYVVEPKPAPPPAPPARVAVTKEKIELKEKIFFATAKSQIKPESFGLLDEVARVLKDHPEIAKVVVEGHTDNVGKAASNLALSKARAEAVARFLRDKGVSAGRLQARGYGETRPIADNGTAHGRETNRRVELMIAK